MDGEKGANTESRDSFCILPSLDTQPFFSSLNTKARDEEKCWMERRENTEARDEEKDLISREGKKQALEMGIERLDIERRENTKARDEEKVGYREKGENRS